MTAASEAGSPLRQELSRHAGPRSGNDPVVAERVAAMAKRLVAAECCFFRDSDVRYERWDPYVSWARQLQDDDTVISFNYDRVVEVAATRAGRVVDPRLGSESSLSRGITLLKLHGSIDWSTDSEGRVTLTNDPE
jgi:hypothetical protein